MIRTSYHFRLSSRPFLPTPVDTAAHPWVRFDQRITLSQQLDLYLGQAKLTPLTHWEHEPFLYIISFL